MFLIDESIGEPAVASLTCNGSSGSACAFFCFHNLVLQSVEVRGKIVHDEKRELAFLRRSFEAVRATELFRDKRTCFCNGNYVLFA